MMTGVVSLIARSEATSGSFTFVGVDLAAYPHLAAAFSSTIRAGSPTGPLRKDPPNPADRAAHR